MATDSSGNVLPGTVEPGRNEEMEGRLFPAVELEVCSKRERGIHVLIREEYFLLPKWYEYYSQFFEDEDIYIMHHVVPSQEDGESGDRENGNGESLGGGSGRDTSVDFLKGTKVNVIPLRQELFSTRWVRDTITRFQEMMLRKYRYIVYTDVDEFIFTDPTAYQDLDAFLKVFDQRGDWSHVKCCCLTLMHLPDKEPDLDVSLPIIDQRKYWYRYSYYDKPLITKKVLNYEFGLHTAEEQAPVLSAVVMLHLHQYDFKHYMKRHTRWALNYKVCDEDKRDGWNYHYRTIGKELEFQYYHYYGTKKPIQTMEIPSWVRTQIRI